MTNNYMNSVIRHEKKIFFRQKNNIMYKNCKKIINRDKYLILMLIPVIVYYIIFHYIPMYGVTIAFKDFSISRGILGSQWVGLRWFNDFFSSYYFSRLIRNTFLMSFYGLLWGFPVPIIFALLLNELKDGAFKRTVQTVSYLPHFISVVIIVGMMVNFLSPSDGIVNIYLKNIGRDPINFLGNSNWFRTLYIGSGIWQSFGFSSIIYLAALSNIDPQLYDAGKIDGCNRWSQMIHITLPGLTPTIGILLILSLGSMMSVGFEKIILMYSPMTYETADVISTFTYRRGILNADYSYGAAVGFFNSVINCTLLVIFNYVSKRISDISLW